MIGITIPQYYSLYLRIAVKHGISSHASAKIYIIAPFPFIGAAYLVVVIDK